MNLAHYQKTLPKNILETIYLLREGNQRFVENKLAKKDFIEQRKSLLEKQIPKAIVLTCSDSRVDPNYIFDADLGALFILRNAGNVASEDVIGSIEFASHYLGTQLLIVMGHTSCGAVIAALNNVKSYPHLVHTLDLIMPAAELAHKNSSDDFVDKLFNATIENVKLQIDSILKHSDLLQKMVINKELFIVGSYYHFDTGRVDLI